MGFRMLTLLCFGILFMPSCQKEAVNTTLDLLVNENGWETIAYRRYEPGDTVNFSSDPVYIILDNYGDALLFSREGKVWINYSNGQAIDKALSINGNWSEMDGRFNFTNNAGTDLQVDIVSLSESELWIKYRSAGDFFEYKLRPIAL